MSTDFSIRPVGAPVTLSTAQPVSQAASNAVATVLPGSQGVTAADTAGNTRNDSSPAPTPAPAPASTTFESHQAFFDRAAAALVFQVVNGKTSQVVEQYPDDATLRRRAYFHALDLSKIETQHVQATDRTA